jgi:translation elongation factor EF-Ts
MTTNSELIEKLFEDSKNKIKEEYQTFIAKIKEDLNKSRIPDLHSKN